MPPCAPRPKFGARPLKSKWSWTIQRWTPKQVPDLTSCQARIVRRLRTSPSTSNSQLRAPSNVHARQSRSHPRMQRASRVQDRSLHTCQCRHALKNVQLVDRSNEKTVTDSHPRERQSYEYNMLCAHILHFHSARMIADVEQKLGREQKKSMHLAPVDEYRPSNTGGHWQAMPYGQTYST